MHRAPPHFFSSLPHFRFSSTSPPSRRITPPRRFPVSRSSFGRQPSVALQLRAPTFRRPPPCRDLAPGCDLPSWSIALPSSFGFRPFAPGAVSCHRVDGSRWAATVAVRGPSGEGAATAAVRGPRGEGAAAAAMRGPR